MTMKAEAKPEINGKQKLNIKIQIKNSLPQINLTFKNKTACRIKKQLGNKNTTKNANKNTQKQASKGIHG